MPRYIESTHLRREYPDKPITSIAYIHIANVPQWLSDGNEKEILKQTLTEHAFQVGEYLNDKTDSEIIFRDGSLIVELLLSSSLNEILSQEHLEHMRLWVSGVVIVGVAAGTQKYIAHCTFRALNKLEREMKSVMNSFSLFVLLKIKKSLRDKRGNEKTVVQQARTGIIGNLRRYYEGIESARNHKLTAIRRIPPMKRAYTNAKDIEATVTNIDDRAYLCSLMGEVLEMVKPITLEEKDAADFNQFLEKTRDIVFKEICLDES